MEITIKGHKVSLYGNFKDGFIFRVYDLKGCMHFVINLLKYRSGNKIFGDIIWKEKNKYFSGEYKRLFELKKKK